jgi:hypothetical protein
VTPASSEIEIDPTPPEIAVILGAPGVENGVTELDVDEAPVPAAFSALIWRLYVVPLARLEIVSGLDDTRADTHEDHEPSLTRYS